jgi:3-oxoacyl-[acyl-carrier protein] reductase
MKDTGGWIVNLGLQGKSVIVTGAAQGMGLAIAETFAAEGANVALVDIVDASAAAAGIRDRGSTALSVEADATRSSDVTRAVQSVLESFGRIDIMVNNAGLLREAYIADTDESLWDLLIAVNLKSAYLFARAVAPTMMAQRSGCIVNASSFAAVIPSAGHGAYAAAKAGVLSLTKTLAGELGPYGIRTFAYIPGVIATALSEKMRATASAQMLSTIPVGQFGTAQDVANVIVLLASESASYINGAAIEITGGKLAVQNVAAAQDRAKNNA